MNKMLKNADQATMTVCNRSRGEDWFSVGAMSFFNTEILIDSNEIGLFITSDRPDFDCPKRYTVRAIHENGKVTTLTPFYRIETFKEAERWQKTLTRIINDLDITDKVESIYNDSHVVKVTIDNGVVYKFEEQSLLPE